MVEVNGPDIKTRSIKIPLKEVVTVNIVIDNGLTATQEIISELDKLNLRDKIVLLKLRGTLVQGKTGDIRFNEIEEFVLKKGVSVFLRNISALKLQELEFEMESFPTDNPQNIEKRIMDEYSKKNPADFNKYWSQLMMALSLEKNEDEKSIVYEDRLLSELKNILELEGILWYLKN